MTHAVTVKRRTVESNAIVVYAEMDITSYTLGGEALTAAEFGLDSVNLDEVIPWSKESTAVVQYRIDTTNAKILAYSATGTAVVATTDIGVVGLRVVGYP